MRRFKMFLPFLSAILQEEPAFKPLDVTSRIKEKRT
jgi:hypothetical protein